MESGQVDLAMEAAATFASLEVPEDRGRAIGSAQAKYLGQQLTSLTHARLGDFEEAAELIKPEKLSLDPAPRLFLESFKCYFEIRAMLAQKEAASLTDLLRAKIKFRQIIQQYRQNKPIVGSVAETIPYETSFVTMQLLSSELEAYLESAEADDESLEFTMELAAKSRKPTPTLSPLFSLGALRSNSPISGFSVGIGKRPPSGISKLSKSDQSRDPFSSDSHALPEKKEDYAAFLKAWENADGYRPELAEARAAIADFEVEGEAE
ncbi:hypothetical protein N9882_01875 [Akkermansiaceae bacterium]|nr:hypothetical protein [Akkermansiaceae bacterium]